MVVELRSLVTAALELASELKKFNGGCHGE
jgi:hypothetical protein